MTWESLGEGIEYKEDFDPVPTRKLLGLDGSVATNLMPAEKTRLLNLLFRTGHLSITDMHALDVYIVPNPDYNGEKSSGVLVIDPPPGASNKHLQSR